MIKTIIKRDGTREPFSARKLNAWGEWASGNTVDWSQIVMSACTELPEEVTSSQLQDALIRACIDQNTWGYLKMAGRLYAPHIWKTIHPNGLPTIKALHTLLVSKGLMEELGYTDEEYAELESVIDHNLDFDTPHFSLQYLRNKYAIQNKVTGEEFETQQFIYMRMAMALASQEAKDKRLDFAKRFYAAFSKKKLSAPTPNYVNLGTRLKGFASCCLYAVADNKDSIGIGNYIGYQMTANSAGIGNTYMTRSIGDPVRGGRIVHNGKLPYLAAMAKEVKANVQAGRGGACTTYYNAFDPEVEVIGQLRNPRSTEDKRNRDLHYALKSNRLFAKKVAKNEDIFLFNVFTAPDLFNAFYDGDSDKFEALYEKYEADETFVKKYVSARDVFMNSMSEAFETGVAYLANMDEINRHTPFKDPIFSSNLCAEIVEPTVPYFDMMDLHTEGEVGHVAITYSCRDDLINKQDRFTYAARVTVIEDGHPRLKYAGELKVGDGFFWGEGVNLIRGTVVSIDDVKVEPEVALCSLAAVNVDKIVDDADYHETMYLSLKMIDYCIYNSEYTTPHIGFTAKQRMNAAVGIMGLATLMARKKKMYNNIQGLHYLHYVFERHMYFAIRASLDISKERGTAPWIHRTKWVDGWTPLATYNRNVDSLGDFNCKYDWDALSAEIKENKGIAHSVLVAYMPGESSSKALGTPNSIYPVRETTMSKTDNSTVIDWAAEEGDNPEYHYQLAYDLTEREAFTFYAIAQKFTDQTISADVWRRLVGNEKVKGNELVRDFIFMVKHGVKTRYYYNTLTSSYDGLTTSETLREQACGSGGCTI